MKIMDTQTLKPRIERVTKQWTLESNVLVPSLGELVSFAYPALVMAIIKVLEERHLKQN